MFSFYIQFNSNVCLWSFFVCNKWFNYYCFIIITQSSNVPTHPPIECYFGVVESVCRSTDLIIVVPVIFWSGWSGAKQIDRANAQCFDWSWADLLLPPTCYVLCRTYLQFHEQKFKIIYCKTIVAAKIWASIYQHLKFLTYKWKLYNFSANGMIQQLLDRCHWSPLNQSSNVP